MEKCRKNKIMAMTKQSTQGLKCYVAHLRGRGGGSGGSYNRTKACYKVNTWR